jgi:hypothetical protein
MMRKMRLESRSEKGSIFVVVIAAVAIAAMIAVSYLTLTNNYRERAGRELDQTRTQIRLEEDILEAKRQIAVQTKENGQIRLSDVIITNQGAETSDSIKLSLNGSDHGTESLSPVVNRAVQLNLLESNGDPFFGARAISWDVSATASAFTNESNKSQLAGKEVTVTPSIEIRQIPVSQFTLFSLNGPVTLDSTLFPESGGRIFAAGDITINGSGRLLFDYPVVSGGAIVTGPATSLSVKTSNKDRTQIDLGKVANYNSVDETGKAQLLAEARTEFDSALITSASLPVDVALVPSESQSASQGFDLDATGKKCEIELIVEVSNPNADGSYPVITSPAAANWAAAVGPGSKPQGRPLRQAVACVAKKASLIDIGSKIVVSIDFAAPAVRTSAAQSIYVHGNGNASDVVVLIRAAALLNHDLSIVTPHTVIIAGDFNSGGSSQAASIITGQNVLAVDSTVGNADFGTAE